MKNAPSFCQAQGATTERRDDVRPNYINARLRRLATALPSSPQGISREEADRLTPASNAPEYVRRLRNRLALPIPCHRIACVTKDGCPSWFGLYRLTREDRRKLREVLK